ncbi:MAG TPA: PhoU domain-containing protein, partial [Nitrososphaeraceae archaeon]
MGSISNCDKSAVLETAKTVRGMILLSLNALQSRDKNAAEKLYEMDDTVDAQYRKYLRDLITSSQEQEKSTEKLLTDSTNNPRCYISALLILRYLERISDHACYIGDSVHYIVTGVSSPRR